MAQTRVTCDVSKGGKVKASGAVSMIRHWARDVDAWHGIYYEHSNESIDRNRSINNMTFFPTDGPRSNWKIPASTEEIQDRLQDRLATVTGRTRKDSVVMRGVVLGLSPEWVEEHTPNWKTDRRDRAKFMDTLQPVVDRVIEKAGGPENVMLVTGHFDEEAPQIQMAVTPVTKDGRLRQNDFDLFKSPGSLAKLHKQIRKELKASGVDVILESSERSREHLSNLDYARKADKERAEESKRIADERKQLDADKAELPRLRQQAVEDGKFEGYREGFEEGQVEALATIQGAEQRAHDIVQQAQANVERLREEHERLEQENKDKREKISGLDKTISDRWGELATAGNEVAQKQTELKTAGNEVADKQAELKELLEHVSAVKVSRDSMTELDSDFLDTVLEDEYFRKQYEIAKDRRAKKLQAATDSAKDYYESTAGENGQHQQQQRPGSPKGGGNGKPKDGDSPDY